MTRRRMTWSTAFVATLLGSTCLHLAATVLTAQAGVGSGTLAEAPALPGPVLGPNAYPVDMSAPSPTRLAALPAEAPADANTSTVGQRSEAPVPVLAEMSAWPIPLFPIGLYGAELRAQPPIRLFSAGLYGPAIRHLVLPGAADDALTRAQALLATETPTAATAEVGKRSAQPVGTAALPVTADMRARQPMPLFPTRVYDGVIRLAALPSPGSDALARAEAILSTEPAAAAPEQSVQAEYAATGRAALPDAHVVLPERLRDLGPAETDAAQIFADNRPLAGADLDQLRGGVFDVDGWKIAFGVNIDVRLDQDFKISTFLNPVTNRGGFALNVRDKVLVRNEDGTITTQGGASITEGPNGTRIDFGDFAASIRETAGGFDLSADGERPVELSQNPAQVVQVVGSEERTLARHQLSPGEIIAQLNNIHNNARASSLATIAIDILNHDERVSVSRTLQRVENLNQLIVRDIMGRIGR